VLNDIGQLVPCLKVGYDLSWCMHDLRLGDA